MDFSDEPTKFSFFNPDHKGFPFDETEIASTFPTKSSTNCVFFQVLLIEITFTLV